MRSWTGLDPGGTEHLWDPQKLFDVLVILDEFAPFNHMDPKSPIYPALTSRMPSTKWFAFDKNGQFRPIFRRTNPWFRLGLIHEVDGLSHTSPLGLDLLEGHISISDVLLMAVQSHVESNGDRSFARIASAFLALKGQHLSANDVIMGLMESYDSDVGIAEQIAHARRSGIKVPSGDRRKRSVSGIMNILVSTGAISLAIDSAQGWVSHSDETLREIAQMDEKFSPIYIESRDTTSKAQDISARAPEGKAKVLPRSAFSAILPDRKVMTTEGLRKYSPAADPQLASLRLERANKIHSDLVADAAKLLIDRGLTPIEDPNSFDIAVFAVSPCLIEVKSIHASNAIAQVRKGISQLLEYRWIHQSLFESEPKLLILVNESPVEHLIPGYIQFLENDLGMQLLWRDQNDFVNKDRSCLYEAIV